MAARVGVAPAGDGLRYSGSLQPPAQPSDADLDRGLVSLNRSCRRSAAPSCPGTPAGAPWSPAGPARAPLRPFTPEPGSSRLFIHSDPPLVHSAFVLLCAPRRRVGVLGDSLVPQGASPLLGETDQHQASSCCVTSCGMDARILGGDPRPVCRGSRVRGQGRLLGESGVTFGVKLRSED